MSKKIKAAPEPVPHSFKLKWGKSEIEANGLGLIPAVFAIVLIVLIMVFGGAAVKDVAGFVAKLTNADPAQIERPPP
jgi:hypothetical protein